MARLGPGLCWAHLARLGKALIWKSMGAALAKDILMWHYLELRSKYYKLVDCKDPRVLHNIPGSQHCFLCHMPMSRWFWTILQQSHQLPAKQLQSLALDVIGDYKRASLNPSGGHRSSGKGLTNIESAHLTAVQSFWLFFICFHQFSIVSVGFFMVLIGSH